MFRRLVSRALAAASVFDQATRPYQFALRTRVGVDALSARRRATLENDARATVVSLDGRSAYDCISRAAFLLKLCDVAPALVPFALALLFYGQPSEYHGGTTTGSATAYPKLRDVNKATDPLAPALFALGQHEALRRADSQLRQGESFMAFLLGRGDTRGRDTCRHIRQLGHDACFQLRRWPAAARNRRIGDRGLAWRPAPAAMWLRRSGHPHRHARVRPCLGRRKT